MPPEASAGVPKGTYRKYVPEGIQVPLRARARKSEQCAGFASVSYERKTLQAFFDFRLKRANPSSGRSRYIRAPLTYRIFAVQKYAAVVLRCDTASMPCIEGSSPRDLQRARSAKFPAQKSQTSPVDMNHYLNQSV